jgi:transcription elongation factor S-II
MPFDRKEVEERGKALSKAQASSEPPSTLIKLLDDLRKGVQPSEELLRSTKIGVLVNKLKTHANKDVARSAAELVSKWRQEVGKGSRQARPSGASTPNKGTQSPAPTSASPVPPKAKGKLEVAPEKRNAKADKVDTKLTGVPTRDACLELMYNGLAFMSEDCMYPPSSPGLGPPSRGQETGPHQRDWVARRS